MADKLQDILITQPMLPSLESLQPMLEDIWSRKHVTNFGLYHNKLEERLSELLQAPHFSLFSSGTSALLIALKALDLKGEVIVTPFTFPATISCIEWAGLTPVFCDIDRHTLCVDPDQIEHLITEKTCAIMGVHVYGIICDVEKIQAIADHYDLKVIYDAAHAFMSTLKGEPVSRFGDVTMFSFHATKLFNTIEGGGLAFKDPAVKEKSDMIKNFGLKDGYPEVSGINAKMNELQAIVGIANLDILADERERRMKLKNAYDEMLGSVNGIKIFSSLVSESFQYYPILVDPHQLGMTRNALHGLFLKNKIYTRKYFAPLGSEYPYLKSLTNKGEMPVAQHVVENILCLPFYGNLLEDGFKRVEAVIKSLY